MARVTHSVGKGGKAKQVEPEKSFVLEPLFAFYLFLAVNTISALWAPIQDCDEVFNYWEPLHYLLHGYGLQTWEYSPEFAIRSWFYIGVHAIVGLITSIIPYASSKVRVQRLPCISST